MSFLSDGLLYICYAFLMGSLLVQLAPAGSKPLVEIPRWTVNLSIVGIILLASAPLLQIIIRFGPSIGYGQAISSVLFTFKEGRAYLIVVGLCILLLLQFLLFKNSLQEKKVLYPSVLITVCIIAIFGWSSHLGAIAGLKGAAIQFLHMLGVAVWIGILLVIAWFTQEARNWPAFLKWYTPVAIAGVLMILVSGLMTMSYTTPEYVNSWILSYGQALLMKHLLFIPLIVFGFGNGFIYKHKLKSNPSFNPIPWLRAEAIIVILVFGFTAFMKLQTPPHEVAETLKYSEPSAMFTMLHPEASLPLSISLTAWALIPGIIALLSLGTIVYSFRRNQSRPGSSLIAGLVFVMSAYAAVMLCVQ
ncbi:copper resistance D family protein [Paenibacillus shunpengii]|uniref:Copper resistance D family protein n=1 Tax=Paenibacillus shunpengii TaxID=2054424 RepID=A0ABW5SQA3_9BACL|nr:CopD family protein [Paenibacillus sp. PDC88]SDX18121.1 putative copper resistance protein D [Paenibacillus sp. PDC88]